MAVTNFAPAINVNSVEDYVDFTLIITHSMWGLDSKILAAKALIQESVDCAVVNTDQESIVAVLYILSDVLVHLRSVIEDIDESYNNYESKSGKMNKEGMS